MGKKKKGAAARKSAEKSCHHLLRPGEKNTPFLAFIKSLGDDIMTIDPPPGQTQPITDPPARFIPRAQQGLSWVTDMVIDVIESGSCFEIFNEQMITITDYFEMPKITMNNLKDRSAEKTKSNLADLAEMLQRVVTEASPLFSRDKKVNPEFTHLIALLKGYQDGDSFFFDAISHMLSTTSQQMLYVPRDVRLYNGHLEEHRSRSVSLHHQGSVVSCGLAHTDPAEYLPSILLQQGGGDMIQRQS